MAGEYPARWEPGAGRRALDGRIDVPYNHAAEPAPVGDRWYVLFPPVPALTYLPLAAVTGYEPWGSKLLSAAMPTLPAGPLRGWRSC